MALLYENTDKFLFRNKLNRSRNSSLLNTYHTQYPNINSNNKLLYNNHKNISKDVGFIFSDFKNKNAQTELSIGNKIDTIRKIISDSFIINQSNNTVKNSFSKKKTFRAKNYYKNTFKKSSVENIIFFKNFKFNPNHKTESHSKNDTNNNSKNNFYHTSDSVQSKKVIKLLKKNTNDNIFPHFLTKSDSQKVFNKTVPNKNISVCNIDEEGNTITQKKILVKKLLKNINDSTTFQKKIFTERKTSNFKKLKRIYETKINGNIIQVKDKIINIFADYDSLLKKSNKPEDNLNSVNKRFFSYSLNSINNMANTLNIFQNVIKDDLFKILDDNNFKTNKHKKKKIDPIFELIFDRELKKEKNINTKDDYKSAVRAPHKLHKNEIEKNQLMRLSEIITNLNNDVALDLANNVLKYNENIRKSLETENKFTEKLKDIRDIAAVKEIRRRNLSFKKSLSYLKNMSDKSRELQRKIFIRLKNYEEKKKKDKIKNNIRKYIYKQRKNEDKRKLEFCIKKYNLIK